MNRFILAMQSVTKEQKKWLIEEAARTGSSQADVVRRLIQAQIDKKEQNK